MGGIDPRVGFSNPPYEKLPEVCERQAAFFFRLAALAPRVVVPAPTIRPLGGAVVEVSVKSLGYVPTSVSGEARRLPWNHGLFLDVVASGCRLVDPSRRLSPGHLEGWGHGRFGSWSAGPTIQRSTGNRTRVRVPVVVEGQGSLTITVSSPRIGAIQHELSIP